MEDPNEEHHVRPGSEREDLMASSRPVEGDPLGLREVMERTRLYHEVSESQFPLEDGELRWFLNGIHVVGPGESPVVYQVPMSRVEEMVVPRESPSLPWIKTPPPTE